MTTGSKHRLIIETSKDNESRILRSRWILRYSQHSTIQMPPAVSKVINSSFIHMIFNYIGMKGNGANLCKISAKRRRTNAEVKAAKEAEAKKDFQLEL